MNIIFWVLVIYVTADVAASAYVIYRRGGIRQSIADIRQNIAYVRDEEDDEDVHNQ